MNRLSRLRNTIGISIVILLAMVMLSKVIGEPGPPPPCVESGPHTNGWVCSTVGVASLPSVVTYTNITVCIDTPFTPPLLNSNVYPLPGPLTRLIWYDCNSISNHSETNYFVYTNKSLVISPSIPTSYSSPGTYNHNVSVWLLGPAGTCQTIPFLGVMTIHVVSDPPTISTQPAGQSANVGGSVSFSVGASGCPAPGYQWRFNGTNILGGTNSILDLTLLQTNNAGNYTVLVTNNQGSVTSSVAALTINSASPSSNFNVLYTFSATSSTVTRAQTNADGADVQAQMILSGSTLYGVSWGGGKYGDGTVFKINTNGTGFTSLHSFDGTNGSVPLGRLVISGNTLYGTTYEGGFTNSGDGTIFQVNTDGTGFAVLHRCTVSTSDGYEPDAGMILVSNTLYGTTDGGGLDDYGTVFSMNTNGTRFTVIHSLALSEGIYPDATLSMSGNTLYGTANEGGSGDSGTVFSVNTDGSGFAVLHNFGAIPAYPGPYTNGDGANLNGGVIVSGGVLYGLASNGGIDGGGTVFSLATNGTGFTTLYNFTKGTDGFGPADGLVLSGGTLYGTTYGGNPGFGTIFSIQTSGASFTTLYSFVLGSDGVDPEYAGLVLSGNTLYGTTPASGGHGSGTIYDFVFASVPVISTQPASQTVVAGGTATFSVAASSPSGSPIFYQWQYNGANIAGATGSTLTLSPVQAIYGGTYTVLVANAQGAVTSASAVLTVQSASPAFQIFITRPKNGTALP